MSFDNVSDLFKELDAKEFESTATALRGYYTALTNVGFSTNQAFQLVLGYAKFIYDMAFEDYMNNPSVDPDEEDEVE